MGSNIYLARSTSASTLFIDLSRYKLAKARYQKTSLLEQLPDELVVEISTRLRPDRKGKSYHEDEDSDDWGMKPAQKTTLALTLTSKRISIIATPLLYLDVSSSAIVDSAPGRITYLIRTIIFNPLCGQQIQHLDHKFCSYEWLLCEDWTCV